MAVAKNEKGGIFWPDIDMDGECHKVQEKHFENGIWPVHPLGESENWKSSDSAVW